jgi:ribosomal protein L31E
VPGSDQKPQVPTLEKNKAPDLKAQSNKENLPPPK